MHICIHPNKSSIRVKRFWLASTVIATAIVTTACGGGGGGDKGGNTDNDGNLVVTYKYPAVAAMKLFDTIQIDPVLGGLGANKPSFAVSGQLPQGMALDANTGRLSGYVSMVGSYSVPINLAVTGYEGYLTSPVLFNVTSAIALKYPSSTSAPLWQAMPAIMPAFTGLEPGDVASNYRLGGPQGANIGVLPAGLSLDAATGAIRGEPDFQGQQNFWVKATVSRNGKTADISATSYVTVSATRPFGFAYPAIPPAGRVGLPMTAILPAAVGGQTGDTLSSFYLAAPTGSNTGSLPPGLRLDPATGAVSGTPTVSGTFVFWASATYTRGTRSIVIPANVYTVIDIGR